MNNNNDDPDEPDDVIAIGHDDPNRGYFLEYVPIYHEQIPPRRHHQQHQTQPPTIRQTKQKDHK